MRGRQVEALKREVSRLRGERDQMRREMRERALAAPPEAEGGGGLSAELRALVTAESSIVQEAAALRQQASAIRVG